MFNRLRNMVASESEKGSFLRATAVLAGGTAAGQLVTMLVGPIVSRLYSVEQTGTLGSFATILSFIAPIACLRYEGAISLPELEQKAERLLQLCLISVVGLALGVLLVVIPGAHLIAEICRDPNLQSFLLLLPLSLIGVGTYQAFNYWAIRQRAFPLVARTKLVQGSVQALCQVALGLLKSGTLGLILGDVLGRVSGAGSILALARSKFGTRLFSFDRAEIKAVAEEYRAFPLVSGPATLLHTATSNFGFALSPIYGPGIFGLYFFGMRFIWGPVSLIGQAMAQVYLGEASRWARTDPERMLRAFDQIVKRLAILGTVPFGILTLAGGPLVAFVFGQKWFEAGVWVQIQAVSWWAMFVVGPVLNTLNILQRQSMQLWIDVLAVVVMTSGFIAGWKLGWNPRLTIGIYSIAITAMYVALFFACRHSILKTISLQTERVNS